MMKRRDKHATFTQRLILIAAMTTIVCLSRASFAISDDVVALVDGNNQFAFDMYAALGADEDENLFFSPLSISTALGMTYAGARGNTAAEMADALHASLADGIYHASYGELLSDFAAPDRSGYELNMANRLWGQAGFPFQQPFLDVTDQQYGAELGIVDFVQQTESARLTINHWVEDRTNGRIEDLLPDGSVSPDTRLVLTNAIYFLADWQHKFNRDDTHAATFNVSPSEQIEVDMMQQETFFRYADLPQAKAVELPYEGDDVSMLLLLPQEVDGLPAVEEWLNVDTLDDTIDALQHRNVLLSLPKFTMESDLPLNDALRSMGVQDAFDATAADFTGITDATQLFISNVLHKAFLHVDEEGTEAAAATAVVIDTTSLPPEPEVFAADHPFLLLLRDNRTDSLLFMGRVVRPEVSENALTSRGGDYNGDGFVDQTDLDLVLFHWGADATVPPEGWTSELPTVMVDQNELDAVLANWGTGYSNLQPNNTPEPATWWLLVAVVCCLVSSGVFRRN